MPLSILFFSLNPTLELKLTVSSDWLSISPLKIMLVFHYGGFFPLLWIMSCCLSCWPENCSIVQLAKCNRFFPDSFPTLMLHYFWYVNPNICKWDKSLDCLSYVHLFFFKNKNWKKKKRKNKISTCNKLFFYLSLPMFWKLYVYALFLSIFYILRLQKADR